MESFCGLQTKNPVSSLLWLYHQFWGWVTLWKMTYTLVDVNILFQEQWSSLHEINPPLKEHIKTK